VTQIIWPLSGDPNDLTFWLAARMIRPLARDPAMTRSGVGVHEGGMAGPAQVFWCPSPMQWTRFLRSTGGGGKSGGKVGQGALLDQLHPGRCGQGNVTRPTVSAVSRRTNWGSVGPFASWSVL